MADTRPRRCKRSPAWNREERRKHVEDQAASGLCVQDYCFAHGLSVRAFYSWRRHHAAAPDDVPATPVEWRPLPQPAFAEVVADSSEPSQAVAEMVEEASEPSQAGAEVEVVLRSGHRLRVGPDFHEVSLRRLVALLESLPC